MDNSELNNKYFIDEETFNCPFCGLRNTTYTILAVCPYNESSEKEAKIVFVKCNRCGKTSIHFLKNEMKLKEYYINSCGFTSGITLKENYMKIKFYIPRKNDQSSGDDVPDGEIDDYIFHSIPSTSFALDERIPKKIRDLFNEAEECAKANLKTGASACLRKLVYTFLYEQLNKIKKNNPYKRIEDMGYKDYGNCISEMRSNYPKLDVYWDILSGIKGITSDQVHEESWGEISAKDIHLYLSALSDLLIEIYVQPDILEEKRKTCYGDRRKKGDLWSRS